MAPKFSSCFTDLIDVLQIDINYDTMSDASSMISQTFSLNTEESNDPQLDSAGSKNNLLQSKNKLVVKKNLLQISRPNNFFSSSSFSLKKSHEDLVQPKNTTIDVFSL